MNQNPFGLPEYRSPVLTVPSDIPVPPVAFSYSDTQLKVLRRRIQDFEAELDQEHETALMLTNFGQTIVMQVTEISCERSVLMVFKGYVNGNSATLIQHISQLNFLLTSVPKHDPESPPRRIGFTANWNE